MNPIGVDRLQSQLLTTGLSQKDQPLYQVISQLIGYVRQLIDETQNSLNTITGGGTSPGQTFVTTENELASLPFSRRLVAGNGITFNNDGQRLIINGAVIPGMDGELGEEGMMGVPGIQGPIGPAGSNAAAMPFFWNESHEEQYSEPFPLVTLNNTSEIIPGQWTFTNGLTNFKHANPTLRFNETGAAADNRIWDWSVAGGVINFLALADNLLTSATALLVVRSGVSITSFRIQTDTGIARTLWDTPGTMDHRFALMLSGQSDVTLAADQTAWSPAAFGTRFFFRVSGTAAWTIRGITALAAGSFITVYNGGSFNIVFTREDGAASAANRIAMDNALFGLTITPGQVIQLYYDGITSRWVVISGF